MFAVSEFFIRSTCIVTLLVLTHHVGVLEFGLATLAITYFVLGRQSVITPDGMKMAGILFSQKHNLAAEATHGAA